MVKRIAWWGLAAAVALPLWAAQQPAPGTGPGWRQLFNGRDLSGWHLRHADGKNAWTVQDGVLVNTERATDFVTDASFGSCELYVEFMVPQGSNSGVYLQGRYEVQIADTAGVDPPNMGCCGAVYSKAVPSENAARPAGEWQTFHITFHSAKLDAEGKVTEQARITVVHNGKTVVDNVTVDSPTGGQLDNDHGKPGPILIQGDHGPIHYRRIALKAIP